MAKTNTLLTEEKNLAKTTNRDRMMWGTVALGAVVVLAVTYVLVATLQETSSLLNKIGLVTDFIILAGSITSIVMTIRGRQVTGAQLALYTILLFGITAVGLTQGRAITASFSVLLIGTIAILNLFPQDSHRRHFVIIGITFAFMWIIEWVNPPWRVESQTAKVGPVAVIVFVIIVAVMVVRQTWGRSMRNKLLVAFTGVTLIAASALAVFAFVSTNNILRQGLEGELTQHTDGVAVSIGNLLDAQVNIITTLSLNEVLQQTVEEINRTYDGNSSEIQSILDTRDTQWRAADAADNNNDPLVREYLNNQAALELREFQRTFPNHVEVFITDVYGGQAGTTNRTSDYLQSDEDWWQAAYNNGEGALYISEPEFDESSNALALLIALPIRNRESGKIIGILRTTYSASALNTILSEQVGTTGETDIFVPGEVVFHFHGGQYTDVVAEEYAALQAVADQGMVEMNYEDTLSVIVQIPVKSLEGNQAVDNLAWVVLFHQGQDEAFAPIAAQTRGLIVVMAIILVLAVGAAVGFSIFLVRPIAQLTQTAEEVAAGNLNSRATVTSTDEVGILASTFNSMTSQLQETLQGLEERVAARTRDLAIVAEVGTATSTILESKRLLQEVVDLTKERFHLYHSHIYLLDEEARLLVLTAGAGEPGRVMVAEGRSIPLDREQSLVARAARERKGVTVNDVTQAPDFLPNPLLPDTRSELAVPMIVGGNVIGVFDIQSEQVGRFKESDVNIQTTLAAQLATSIQNVRSFEQSKKQAELQSLVNVIGSRIQRTTSIEETLQTAIRELGTAIGASRVKAKISRSNGDS